MKKTIEPATGKFMPKSDDAQCLEQNHGPDACQAENRAG
jgi:hypothetical protein